MFLEMWLLFIKVTFINEKVLLKVMDLRELKREVDGLGDIDDFKKEMEQADKRIKNLARQRSNEIISSFKNARKKRAEITYELGKTAEIKSAQTSLRRAESFDILVNRIMID